MKRSKIARNIALPVIIALIGLLVARMIRPDLVSSTDFAIKNADDVTGIYIGRNGILSGVERGEAWIVNARETANRQQVNSALRALEQLQADYPLPANLYAAYDSAIRHSQYTHLALYDKWGPMRRYRLLRLDSLNVAEVRSGRPYVVSVIGNRSIDVASLFDSNPLFWLPTVSLSVNPSWIRRVIVEDCAHPHRSFRVDVDSIGHVALTYLQRNTVVADTSANALHRYLSYFREVEHLRYATELSSAQQADITAKHPAYRINVALANDSVAALSIFTKQSEHPADEFGRPATVDLNYCYVLSGTAPCLALARWVDVDLLLAVGHETNFQTIQSQ